MTVVAYSRHVYDAIEALRKAKMLASAVDEPNQANLARLAAAVEQCKSALACLTAAHESIYDKLN